MGQKINPIANRLGIIRGWDSNWFGGSNFGDNILEDSKIREYLDARFKSYVEKPGRASASKKEYTSVYEYISRIVIRAYAQARYDHDLHQPSRYDHRSGW